MKKLDFTISINAPKSKVWKTLWDDQTYRLWTKPFSEGSFAMSEWKQGSRVHFLNGEGGGMYSEIEVLKPEEEMTFRHIGEIKDGKELAVKDENSDWYGGRESYFLSETAGGTHLHVIVDIVESYEDFMNEKFPKALEELKSLCER